MGRLTKVMCALGTAAVMLPAQAQNLGTDYAQDTYATLFEAFARAQIRRSIAFRIEPTQRNEDGLYRDLMLDELGAHRVRRGSMIERTREMFRNGIKDIDTCVDIRKTFDFFIDQDNLLRLYDTGVREGRRTGAPLRADSEIDETYTLMLLHNKILEAACTPLLRKPEGAGLQ